MVSVRSKTVIAAKFKIIQQECGNFLPVRRSTSTKMISVYCESQQVMFAVRFCYSAVFIVVVHTVIICKLRTKKILAVQEGVD